MATKQVGSMTLTTPGDREIQMSRVFDAPRAMVYEAFTKPALLKRWLGVHNGWTMPVCEIDLKVGGRFRYEWQNPNGTKMGMGGVYREIVPAEKIVATEKFDESWYPGEAVGTTTFVERDGKTTLLMAVLYESSEARDAVLKTPMEQGVAAGLDTLANVLKSVALIGIPEVVEMEAQLTAVIPLNIPVSQVREMMGPGIKEVYDVLKVQGVPPTGAWANHHFKNPSSHFDFEIVVPIAKPITANGRVKNGSWPAMKAVRASYRGPYEGLGDAWGTFDKWIAASGLKTSGELWEQYVKGPESTSNSAEYVTELSRPIID